MRQIFIQIRSIIIGLIHVKIAKMEVQYIGSITKLREVNCQLMKAHFHYNERNNRMLAFAFCVVLNDPTW